MVNVPFAPLTGYQWIKTKNFIRWNVDRRVLAVYYGEDILYILVREDDKNKI